MCTARSDMLVALRLKFLDTGDLVTGCPIILIDLCCNNNIWRESSFMFNTNHMAK